MKRWVNVFLALAMVLTMFPVAALAAEGNDAPPTLTAGDPVPEEARSQLSGELDSPDAEVPGKPNITTVVAGYSTITVTWTSPETDGGAAIRYYLVDAEGEGGYMTSTDDGSTLTYTLDGLKGGSEYTVRVAAVNDVGMGEYDTVTANTLIPTVYTVTFARGEGVSHEIPDHYAIDGRNGFYANVDCTECVDTRALEDMLTFVEEDGCRYVKIEDTDCGGMWTLNMGDEANAYPSCYLRDIPWENFSAMADENNVITVTSKAEKQWKVEYVVGSGVETVTFDGEVYTGAQTITFWVADGDPIPVPVVEVSSGCVETWDTAPAGNASEPEKFHVQGVKNVISDDTEREDGQSGTGGIDRPSRDFADLKAGAWYCEAVDYVLDNDMMDGVDSTHFAPDGIATRAMVAAVLWRLEGEPAVDCLMLYSDVDQEQWYADAVRWAAAEGIAEGYGDGRFGPNDAVTREQLAAMLYRYEKYKGGGFVGSWMFPLDAPDRAEISHWAYEAMCWMTMKGVINGMGDGILAPKGTATRAQIAQILMKYLELP